MSTQTTITSYTNEDPKRGKFLRLSKSRLDAALEQIRLIKNCFSNPYSYQYDYRDVDSIVSQLQAAIDQLKHYKRMQLDQQKLAEYLKH